MSPLGPHLHIEPPSPFTATVATTGIGDVTSTAKGSGARFNAGKPPMELLPARVIADFYRGTTKTEGERDALLCLDYLAHWQESGAQAALLNALAALAAPLQECAHVFDYGRAKYAAWNWAKGMPWSVPFACAVRHLVAILDGQETDPESGRLHMGHVACNIVMLMTFQKTYPEGNDMPQPGLLG